MWTKKDFYCLFFLVLSLAFFYPQLLLARTAALSGDHLLQHYPWAYLFAESLRHGELPLWTDLIQMGFPITAEGQIGTFYLPNWILYLLLPFRWAYSYVNVIHFVLSGFGTYWYARQMKLDHAASFFSAFVFLFGSAFGGAFYNITSLKTIAWFPWSLFFFERYYEHGKLKYLSFLAVCLALMLLAGYLQVATLTLGIFLFYACVRIFIFSDPGLRTTAMGRSISLILTVMIAVIFAFPQLVLTFQLALYSTRIGLSEDFTYVGSLSPISLLTFFFPLLQGILRGNCLYSGLLTIFLVLCAMSTADVRRKNLFRTWCAVWLVALFLALGQWSPLYIGLVKLTRFYSFRVPAKFLVYVCFGTAILGGIGVQVLVNHARGQMKSFSWRIPALIYLLLVLAVFLMQGVIFGFLTLGSGLTEHLGKWYVETFIYGRSGHPHNLEVYYAKLTSAVEVMRALFSCTHPFNMWTIMLMVASIVLIFSAVQRRYLHRTLMVSGFLFLFVDLRVFSEIDMKLDFLPYAQIERPVRVTEALKEEQAKGGVTRILGFRQYGETTPLPPSTNILHGFEDLGIYSPFAMKRYFESIGLFGNVDDSNFAYSASDSFLLERLPLLNFLDVSHIISRRPIHHEGLELLSHDDQNTAFLYRNMAHHARAHFLSKFEAVASWSMLRARLMQPGFDPQKLLLIEEDELKKAHDRIREFEGSPRVRLELEERRSARETWQVETNQPGFFVVARTMYPGWMAKVNGEPVELVRAYGLFQSVWIDKPGLHHITIQYKPSFWKILKNAP